MNMPKDNETKLNGQSGEITTIREILMGSQLGAYEKRFAAIEDRLAAIEAQLKQTSTENKAHIQQMNTTLQADLNSRILKIENQVKESTQNERQELGKLFAEISNRLLK